MRTPLLAAAAVLLGTPALAQTTFGLTAGLNVATISFENEDALFPDGGGLEKSAMLAFSAGAFADVPVTPMLSFHPELTFSQKGVKIQIEDNDLDLSAAQTLRLGYLEVPLLLRYAMPVGENGLTVGVEAGPALGYRLTESVSCSGDGAEFCDDDDIEDDAFEDVEASGALGLTVGAGPFAVSARYTHGFTSVVGDEDPDSPDARNRVFNVSARYRFGR